MQIIIGKYMGQTTRLVEPDRAKGHTWNAFNEVTLTLLIERPDRPPYTLDCQVGSRDFDLEDLPGQGEYVAFDYSVTARASNGRAYMTYKVWRRLHEAEALLSAARG